jgi:hypothetical protein
MSKKNEIENNEAIKNLLIVLLLKEGVDPKIVEVATGIPEMTIRGKFPMKLIKKTKGEEI